jgi:HK97 family phage prohead protease
MLVTKSISESSLKDVDSKQGIVTFAWAHFGSVDRDGDIIQDGAYTKSLNENGNRIDHLYNHKKGEPVGKIIETYKEGDHMISRSQLSKSTRGRDLLEFYKEGLIKGHSHGMYLVKSGYEGSTRIIKEAKLFEVSSLTVEPANPNTPLLNLKSLQGEVEKILKVGSLSDDFLSQVEELKALIENHLEPQKHSEPESIDKALSEKLDVQINKYITDYISVH